MSDTITLQSAPFNELAYLVRVTWRDHRAIEEALAGNTLLTEGPNLGAVVVEATYAASEPPLLKRLREDRIKQVIEPQSLRFTGARFLEVEALSSLPYAPAQPILISDFTEARAAELAKRALDFQQEAGADIYMAPGLPLYDGENPAAS